MKPPGPSSRRASGQIPSCAEGAHGIGHTAGIQDDRRQHGASLHPASRVGNHLGRGQEDGAGWHRPLEIATAVGELYGAPVDDVAQVVPQRQPHPRYRSSPETSLAVKDGEPEGFLAHQDRLRDTERDEPGRN